jgi:hypothetical protein
VEASKFSYEGEKFSAIASQHVPAQTDFKVIHSTGIYTI